MLSSFYGLITKNLNMKAEDVYIQLRINNLIPAMDADRKRLFIETIEEFERQVKLCNIPHVINQACIYEPDNTTAMNCKHCKNPKWTH